MRIAILLLLWAAALFAQSGLRHPGFVGSLAKGNFASASDSFDRSDANPMSTTMSSGWTWTAGPGDMDAPEIASNNLRGTGAAESGCIVAAPLFEAGQATTITLAGSGGSLLNVGAMVRMQADGSGYIAVADAATTIKIYKLEDTGSWVYTQLGGDFTVSALTSLDTITLGISGTTLTLFHNGVSQGTRTDSSYATGQPGIYFFGASALCTQFSATSQ